MISELAIMKEIKLNYSDMDETLSVGSPLIK